MPKPETLSPKPNRFSVAGKRIIVTGASSGLGRQFALTLAEEGALVIVAARRQGLLEALAIEINARGGSAIPVVLDVTSKSSIDDAIDKAVAALGGIDVLVNNSGVVIHKPLLEHTDFITIECNVVSY